MKKVILFTISLLFSVAMNAQENKELEVLSVYADNTSNEVIFITMQYQKQNSKKWKVKKSYKVKPGKFIKLFSTNNEVFYWYARTEMDHEGRYKELGGPDQYIKVQLIWRGLKKVNIKSECKESNFYILELFPN